MTPAEQESPLGGLPTQLLLFGATGLAGWWRARAEAARRRRCIEPLPAGSAPLDRDETEFDCLIVGAGPAGATAAYWMARESPGLRVALIDKKAFPRPKPCGDAWCAPGLDVLEEMGCLQRMQADGVVQVVRRGGFISPFGYRCINTDGASYGSETGCRTYAIKRHIADEYIVRCAVEQPGVSLFEGCEVLHATLSGDEAGVGRGVWTLTARGADRASFTGRLLLIADGSTSYLAQKLGMMPRSQPQAVCSHCYVAGGSHAWTEADGVMIFNRATLPGYSALFRHYNNDMYLGTYILPGGAATSRCIAPFEEEAIQRLPYVRDAFGPDYSYTERRVVAPIRVGGARMGGAESGPQCLIAGDAAGHVDPLTGEGIHTAIVGGKIAGQCAAEMLGPGGQGPSPAACTAFALRCYDAFGYEFKYSSWAAQVIVRMPICLDAMAVVGARRGQAFLDFFGEVMTGVKPKSAFLQPGLLLEVAVELVRQVWIQYVLRAEPLMPVDVGVAVVQKQAASRGGGGGV